MKSIGDKAARLAKENAVLARIGRVISSTLEIEKVYEQFAKEAKKLIEFDRININVVDSEKQRITIAYATGMSVPEREIGDSFPFSGTVTELAMKAGKGVSFHSDDEGKNADQCPGHSAAFRAGLRSSAAVPLISNGVAIGILFLHSKKAKCYSREDLRVAEVIGLQIAGAIGNARLSQARMEMEKEIIREKEEWEKTFHAVGDPIAILDNHHRIIRVNKAMGILLGTRPEELTGLKCYERMHGTSAPPDSCPHVLLLQDGLEHRAEIFEGRLASWFDVTVSPIFDDTGKLAGSVHSARDITERKRSEDLLRESEGKYRTLFDNAGDAIFIHDAEERMLAVNPMACERLGFTHAELMSMRTNQVDSPEEAPYVPDRIARLMEHGHLSFETVHLRKDGSLIPTEVSARRIIWNGQPAVMSICHDITERKRAEVELRETNLYLEKATARANSLAAEAAGANAAKSEFLANMSHEIRTPMNGVIGMTGLLLDTDLSPEQRQYAKIVRTSGESLLVLLNDILDLSKIEARKLDLEVLDFDLRTTLEDTAEMLAVKAEEKGLDLVCLAEPEVSVLLRGDPGRLRQILVNLGGNAVKFTHKGGVTLRASLVSEDEGQATIRFAVTDTGIGIPRDKQENLFAPFTQVDGSTTRKYGGTGLGLAISKQLVELMGGAIGFESEEGRGSTFWFTAVFEKQPAGRIPEPPPLPDLAGVRVLVVDDQDTNRLVVTTLLKSWGCRFAEAADGEAVLLRLREAAREGDPYRVALLDMQMPGMDGAELGRRIKGSPDVRDTRLIMLTSLGERGDAARLTQLGFDGYLTKPLRRSQLRDCLALVLGRAQAPQAAPAPGLVTRHTVSESQKRRVRVLVAEDNITNQKVALAILEKLGYRADAVANGREAIRALETVPYDLVLMDCQMPEMDGFEATRRIRNSQSVVRNPNVPIIAMTAHTMKGDREKCLEAGMNDYIAKPVEPRALIEVIDRWLFRGGEAKGTGP